MLQLKSTFCHEWSDWLFLPTSEYIIELLAVCRFMGWTVLIYQVFVKRWIYSKCANISPLVLPYNISNTHTQKVSHITTVGIKMCRMENTLCRLLFQHVTGAGQSNCRRHWWSGGNIFRLFIPLYFILLLLFGCDMHWNLYFSIIYSVCAFQVAKCV